MQPNDDPSLESYRSGVKICGIAALVLGVTWLAFAAMFLLICVLGGTGVLNPHESAQERMFGVVGTAAMALLFGAGGAVNLAAGSGMRRLRPWGRGWGIAAAALNMVTGCGCVVGIALSVWMLVVLLDARAPAAFAPAPD